MIPQPKIVKPEPSNQFLTLSEYHNLMSKRKKHEAKLKNPYAHIQKGWRTIAGKEYYFKSLWELNYALYCQFLKDNDLIKSWEYEPQTFLFEEVKSGIRSYKPDFKILRLNGDHYWAEVKGFFDKKSMTKINRFKKYYPNEELRIIDKKWFDMHRNLFPVATEGWTDEN